MNKADLIAKIVGDTGLSKDATGKALNSMIEGIGEALKKGDCGAKTAARLNRGVK